MVFPISKIHFLFRQSTQAGDSVFRSRLALLLQVKLFGLLDPFLAVDAVFEGEARGELFDLFVGPDGDLFVGVDAELMQALFEHFGDAFECGEVVDVCWA